MKRAVHAFEKALHIAPYQQSRTAKPTSTPPSQRLQSTGNQKILRPLLLAFERVLQMEPLDAPTYQLMGNGYAQAGQFERAINYYQKAIDLNPVDALTQQTLRTLL